MAKKVTASSLWENTVRSVTEKNIFQKTAVDNLLRPLFPVRYTDGTLFLETPNSFAPQILNHRYLKKLNAAAKEFDEDFLTVKFALIGEEEEKEKEEIPTETDEDVKVKQTTSNLSGKKPFSHPINPQYVFTEFVDTYENRLAVASAYGVAKEPGKTQNYNPFFIYGKAGVGKTHLAHAIANEITKTDSKANVILMSGNEFYRKFSSHLSQNTYGDFEKSFRTATAIVFDDIDELTGKTEAQLELYKVFNNFHQSKKQMIFTAGSAPSELSGFHERIITRLQWGLAVKLDVHNRETQSVILSNMARKSKINLSGKEIAYIIDNSSGNIHELQGIIANIAVSASVNKTAITEDIIQEVMKNRSLEPIKGYFPAKTIIETVCSYYKVDPKDLKSKSRVAHIAYGRQVAVYFLKKHTPLSLQAIGNELGGKNHSTVLHSLNEVKNKMKGNDKFIKELKEISSMLMKNRKGV